MANKNKSKADTANISNENIKEIKKEDLGDQGTVAPADNATAPSKKELALKAELEEKTKAEKLAKEKQSLEGKTKSPAAKLVEKYRKLYPDNKVFYVTSDMQVFLQSDQNMAVLHQKTLKDGELEIIKL